MAIKKIDKVYCSLNLGYVYNVNYSFSPQQGVRITLFFVSESGVYNRNILSPNNKAMIRVGGADFSMYPVSWENTKNGTQKTFKVDFIDDTFRLKNYYVSLKGKGCGEGVFQLGKVVDTRTDGEKLREDPDLFEIKKFTQDSDLEYSFADFIVVLRKRFSVKTLVSIDSTITRPFEGTFDEVLGAWCSYFNYSYFFENGSLVIFNPTSLNITFPSIPSDAIDYSESNSIENTYDKTVWSNFYQDGKEISIGSSETENNIYISNETLYPWESLFDIKVLNDGILGSIDMNQVCAAQYGKEFWLIYNYKKGTAKEICGFDRYQANPKTFDLQKVAEKYKLIQSSLGSDKDIAFFDEDLFNKNFNFYYEYGRNIAGRYYVSKTRLDIGTFSLYQWYDQNEVVSFTIENLKQQPSVSPNLFLRPAGSSYGFVDGSSSEYFKGIALNSPRFYYVDKINKNFETEFALTDENRRKVDVLFKNLTGGDFGSGSIQWQGEDRPFVIYSIVSSLPPETEEIIQSIEKKINFFDYRYKNFQMKGFFNAKVNDEQKDSELFDDTDIQLGGGPQVSSNTSILKAKKDSQYVAYCSKFNLCNSESTNLNLLNRRFESFRPSIDIPMPIRVTKNSKNVIQINRDLSFVNKYKDSGILKKIAIPFQISEKKLSFTLNYFLDDIPSSFISNGLVGLSISVSESGLTASYSYSNEMLRVPPSTQLIEKLERAMKSSWIRTYNPQIKKDI